ncbi:uncharacterized protein LOC115717420 [Cannabis sativa]|uniref:uncharacterized protein LOC115717420 n=1 Tax=Cannabis sativa TaxID=3483 RepID=UPI0011DF97DE|nr:uncharacterized protein LOC115717420 [Cannabis sativa]
MDQTHAILNLAESYLAEYKATVVVHNAPLPEAKPVATISWTPPPQGLLKLNIDVASSKNHLKVGLGGIIRNSYGEVVAAIAFPHTRGGDTAILEAKSILKSLHWCIKESFHLHQVETSCKAIIDALAATKEDLSLSSEISSDEASIWIGDDPCNLAALLFP